MDLIYKKELQKHGLSVSDLPEDAQTGIEQINDVLKALRMLEQKGKKPTAKSLKKLKAMDKWVYYEILDYLHDSDDNEDEIPHDADEIIDEIDTGNAKPSNNVNNDEDEEDEDADPIGVQIDVELSALYATGKTVYTIDELQAQADETYGILFSIYEDGAENGIVTSTYSLMEQKDKTFKLKKK